MFLNMGKKENNSKQLKEKFILLFSLKFVSMNVSYDNHKIQTITADLLNQF